MNAEDWHLMLYTSTMALHIWTGEDSFWQDYALYLR